MVLLLMAVPLNSLAESLFSLPETSQVEDAPNYGLLFGVEPNANSTLDDGSTKQVYNQINDDNFLAFGQKLAELGYIVESQQVTDEGIVEIVVAKGDLRFTVAYDQKRGSLNTIYPPGVKVAAPKLADPFTAFTPIELGETIDLGFGELTLTEYHPDEKIQSCYYDYVTDKTYRISTYPCWIEGTYKNTSKATQEYEELLNGIRQKIIVVLYYVNENGVYYYFTGNAGELIDQGILYEYHFSSYGITKECPQPIKSLVTHQIGLPFYNVPDEVLKATDGYLAITIQLSDDPDANYVLYLRKP